MTLRVAVASVCLLATSSAAQMRPLPDPQPFLEQVKKRLQPDEERQSGYMYVQTQRTEKLDKAGRSTSESVTVAESYPGLPGEGRWNREISKDGQPVPPLELEKLDADRRKHVEEYARKLASNPTQLRASEATIREKRRREAAESVDDVYRVFEIRMTGRETVDGHDTIAFTLTPRANAKPATRAGNIMRNFSGRAWISESDYELVRLELEAIDTVSIGFGLLARLHKGSQLWFQRRKINDEVWLPASAKYSFSARVGLLAVLRRGGSVEFSNYKKFSVDTTTVIGAPRKP
jgi:hypothetical protein